MTPLLDTAALQDALATGRTAPADYTETGLRITADEFPSVTLMGPDGSVDLTGAAEIGAVIRALVRAVAIADRPSLKIAAAAA